MFISHKYKAIFVHIQRTGGNSVSKVFEEEDPGLVEAIPIDPAKQRTKHCYITDIAAAVDPATFQSYTKFCVVRNPFDRLVSWYAHLRDAANKEDAPIKLTAESLPMRLYQRGRAALSGRPTLARAYTRAWAGVLRTLRTGSDEEVALRFEAIGDRVRREVHRLAPSFDDFVGLPRDGAGGLFERFHVNQLDYVSDGERVLADRILRFERLDQDFAALAAELGFPGRLGHRNAASRSLHYREAYSPATRERVAQRFARDYAHFGYAF